ncbi:unnamed protein product, partial [Candidula unifasciata]
MRPSNTPYVLCLSCIVLSGSVNSQKNCSNGWFGSKCNYKCRCTYDACDERGECTTPNICQAGWFGPGCQYADLAYNRTDQQDVADGNDATCLSGNVQNINVLLNDTIYFSWLRLIVSATGSAYLKDLSVRFHISNSEVTCPGMQKEFVGKMTLDMHCELPDFIDEVSLEGEAASYACSVYVSGGRNVALRENTTQSSNLSHASGGTTIFFTSDLAVDGNREAIFFDGKTCTHTDLLQTTPQLTWSLTLSKPRRVNRYLIFSRGG